MSARVRVQRTTYPPPAHAEALEERERALVHHDLPDAVERTLVLVRLVVHQAHLDHICAHASTIANNGHIEAATDLLTDRV